MNRPGTLAEVARRVNAGSQGFEFALREFVDSFYMSPGERQSMIAEEPEPLANVRQHAALGGVGEHLARRWKLDIPAWTERPSRFLKRLISPPGLRASKPCCWSRARSPSDAA